MQTRNELVSLIKLLLKDDTIVIQQQLQELWSGYGAIVRCLSLDTHQTYIVKLVNENSDGKPHPRGWNTSTSHQRKLLSYKIEANFYQHYSHLTDINCYTPKLIAHEKLPHGQVLVMEDLDAAGYQSRITDPSWENVQLGIRWLAYFHAKFMQKSDKSIPPIEHNLWPIGGYWHLVTRQDEWAAMSDTCVISKTLKSSANSIDKRLNSSTFQTLIHGDAKLENMCFNLEDNAVAAVDFQYIGFGIGVKDLAYFVGSAFHSDDLAAYEDRILNTYFSHLTCALTEYDTNHKINMIELEAEYRALYPLAWADFHRFLLGWNPESWKVNDYMNYMTKKVLASLS